MHLRGNRGQRVVERLAEWCAVKYALIVLISIGLTLAVFEIFIRRIGFMRFLFGMKRRVQPGT